MKLKHEMATFEDIDCICPRCKRELYRSDMGVCMCGCDVWKYEAEYEDEIDTYMKFFDDFYAKFDLLPIKNKLPSEESVYP